MIELLAGLYLEALGKSLIFVLETFLLSPLHFLSQETGEIELVIACHFHPYSLHSFL